MKIEITPNGIRYSVVKTDMNGKQKICVWVRMDTDNQTEINFAVSLLKQIRNPYQIILKPYGYHEPLILQSEYQCKVYEVIQELHKCTPLQIKEHLGVLKKDIGNIKELKASLERMEGKGIISTERKRGDVIFAWIDPDVNRDVELNPMPKYSRVTD